MEDPFYVSSKLSVILQLGTNGDILFLGSLILRKPPTDGQSWSFPEVGLPQIIHFHSIFHDKPSISIIGVPPFCRNLHMHQNAGISTISPYNPHYSPSILPSGYD